MSRRSTRKERFESIYQAMEPVRTAKKNTIHALAGIGRRHKILRYPMLVFLFVFLFLYNLFLYAFMGLKMEKKLARACAMAMTAILIFTSVDITVFALSDDFGEMQMEESQGMIGEAISVVLEEPMMEEETLMSAEPLIEETLTAAEPEEELPVVNEEVVLYSDSNPVAFLNSGYPYGKNMNSSTITLVMEVDGTATSYQWQSADSRTGDYSNISGATVAAYTFTPTSGKWYRCVVDGTASEAVMAVYPDQDGRKWTKPYTSWYLGNGTMAYMANGTIFDAVGLYTKNSTDYMLCTSYGRKWDLFSSTEASPAAGTTISASLDALRVSFSAKDEYALIFEADLAAGQQAFSFGCDTQLGDSSTSGNYSDWAALNALIKNGAMQQVAMIGAATVEGAADDDPAFVIAPITPASRFWIGGYSSRKTYAYNTSGGSATEVIDGQNVVTLLENLDSGMTMSWMNIPSGDSVKFQFSVGDVAHTGAINGKVDYEKEKLTGLDPNTQYEITAGDDTHTVISDEKGEIPLSGQDISGNPYDLTGKNIKIAKKDSSDTPAEIEIAGRPDTPQNPSDLTNEGDRTPTVDSHIEIVELTPTSITISPKVGQQYAYSVDQGQSWIELTDLDENGHYLISGLPEGAMVRTRTRVAATSDAPASQWSEATVITLKRTVSVSAAGWHGTYNGEEHSINVTVSAPTEGATITYSSMADDSYSEENPAYSAAGEYTVYYRVTAEGYYPAYGSATVSIDKKGIAVSGIEMNDDSELEKVEFSGLITGDELLKDTDYSASDLHLSSNTTGSVATVSVSLQDSQLAKNYRLTNGDARGVFTLHHTHTWEYKLDENEPNEITAYCKQSINSVFCPYYGEENAVMLALTASGVTYSGEPYSGVAVIDGISSVTGASVSDIDYYESTGQGSTTISGEAMLSAPVNAGNYVAVCTVTPVGSTESAAEAKAAFAISPAVISEEDVSLAEDTFVYDGTAKSPDVIVTVGETTLVKGRDYTLTGDVSAVDVGDSYQVIINGKGNYTGAVRKTWKMIDTTAPTGTIQISENRWNTLLGGVTFDIFYKKTQTVTITAEDEGSGLEQVSYYVSNTGLSAEQVEALKDSVWTQGTTFRINPDRQYVVYAKLMDKSGNVTYISSDGVVLDATAPVILGVTDGKTYCETQTITISDDHLDKVLVNGVQISLTEGSYMLVADGTSYVIKAEDRAGNETIYTVTVNPTHTFGEWTTVVEPTCTEKGVEKRTCIYCGAEDFRDIDALGHTVGTDEAVDATCTTNGTTQGSHCEVCREVFVAQKEVPALGHDWSGEWTVTKEATATTEGKEEATCTRGCGQKKVRTIPVVGTTDDLPENIAGSLEKDVEVAKDAPIEDATLNNKKSDLLDAPAVFTQEEKQSIQSGSDARVWLEVSKTNENIIPAVEQSKVKEEAEKIMGENPTLTYFDADLFKQVDGGEKTRLHEPGISVRVTIQIPKNLLVQDKTIIRGYKVIRLHTDVATGESLIDVLDGTFDETTGEFSFETDKFSTFVIAYSDTQLVTGVTLDKSEESINQKDGSLQLTATVAPANASNKDVTWTTSDANVATVDANGKVTAVANGTCTITVTTADGGFTAICTVKVDIPADNNDNAATVTAAPETGDDSNLALYFLLLLLSMTAMTGVGMRRKNSR
ncbi:MAG: Ig-like domain-containing protein [Lachnospiraceae bacterium]|nr:Ig-like domain-containing protein [Lachnospiraceae bacterium]